MLNEAQLERFVGEFHVDPVSGCWVWDGRTSCLGFAMFDLGGGFLSYALEVARAEWCDVPVPPGHIPVDTSWRFCRNRLCISDEPVLCATSGDGGRQASRRDEHGVHIPDDNPICVRTSRRRARARIWPSTSVLACGHRARWLPSANSKTCLPSFQPSGENNGQEETGKTETSIRAIKETLTKSALINLIAEQNDIPRKTAIGVFNTLESVMLGSVHPRGVGEFTLPGLCKITLRKVPARKAGTLIRNPATGEMMKGAAKPASVRVKIRALSKLKGAAIS